MGRPTCCTCDFSYCSDLTIGAVDCVKSNIGFNLGSRVLTVLDRVEVLYPYLWCSSITLGTRLVVGPHRHMSQCEIVIPNDPSLMR